MLPLQILVISLKHSTARQEKVAHEMEKTGLSWRFLEAVDGSKLDMTAVAYHAAKVRRLLGFEMTPKEVGCYMSHMKAWQCCVDGNVPTLVFEDDFVVESHLVEVLGSLLNEQSSWHIVRLQALSDCADSLVKDFGAYRLVRNEGDPLGATAYLLKPASASQLLACSSEIYEPLDHYIEHPEKHGLSMLAVKPYPVTVVDPTRATSTITDRPDRRSIRGWKKWKRSFFRQWDRVASANPWFPRS